MPARAAHCGERAVHRRADADRVQARALRQTLADLADQLTLEADVAVGHQHDLALAARAERSERLNHGLRHLRRAAGAQALQPLHRRALPVPRGRDRLRGEADRPAAEGDQLDAIARSERVDHGCRHPPELVERLTVHRAADVDQEDEIAVQRARLRRRRHQRQQAVRLPFVRLRRRASHRERRAERGRLHRPADHHVAVERGALVEAHARAPAAVDDQRVRGRLNLPLVQRVADRQLEAHPSAHAALGHVDRHPLRVGHPVLGAEVARADHRREAPLPCALVDPAEALVDLDLDLDLGARRDVADLLREEAGAILLQQGGGLPLDERLLEARSGLLAPVDLADDALFADLEREAGDRAVARQGQEIGHPQRLGEGVHEALGQHHAADAAGAFRGQVRPAERHRAAVGGDQASAGGRRGGVGGVEAHRGLGHALPPVGLRRALRCLRWANARRGELVTKKIASRRKKPAAPRRKHRAWSHTGIFR